MFPRPSISGAGFSDLLEHGTADCVVASVTDGDTIECYKEGSSGDTFTVRLLGIKTPEIKKHQDDTTVEEPWGRAAKGKLEDYIMTAYPSHYVTLRFEPDAHRTDSYGRYLCWVWCPENYYGVLVNAALIRDLLAYADFAGYDGNTYGYYDQFMELEEIAKKTNMKIWGEQDSDFEYPEQNVLDDFSSKYVYPLHYKYLRDRLAFIEVPESNTITESDFADADVGDVLEEISASTIKLHVKPHTYNHTDKIMGYQVDDIYYPGGIIQFVKIDDAQPINPMLTNKIDYIHFAYIDYLDSYELYGERYIRVLRRRRRH
jgi:endonuclease YncB( thermonuclease family)